MGPPSNNTSGYKGVSWNIGAKKWRAAAVVSGRNRHIGYFDDPRMAMMAYNATAWQHHGKYARLDPAFIAEFKKWRALRNLANRGVAVTLQDQ